MKIAVTLNVLKINDRPETRDTLDQAWYEIFQNLGFTPVLIPNNLSLAKAIIHAVKLDGLLLTGGNNISSSGAGDAPVREEIELFLIDYFTDKDLPVIGICRGMQILNQYFGGNLSPLTGHVAQTHSLKNQSALDLPSTVNSYHNFGVTFSSLGKGLTPLATDEKEKWVEAFKHESKKIKAIMWHPEREPKNCNKSFKLISDHFRGIK
jgi:putative glutamine amidotransferase